MSPQGFMDLEKRNANGSITLYSLKEAGEALQMNLVSGSVPHDDSLEEVIEKRAQDIAVKIVKRTSVTSLVDQTNSNERLIQR